MMMMMVNYTQTRPRRSFGKRPPASGRKPREKPGRRHTPAPRSRSSFFGIQHTTSEVAHKAAFEKKRTWVDPQLRP